MTFSDFEKRHFLCNFALLPWNAVVFIALSFPVSTYQIILYNSITMNFRRYFSIIFVFLVSITLSFCDIMPSCGGDVYASSAPAPAKKKSTKKKSTTSKKTTAKKSTAKKTTTKKSTKKTTRKRTTRKRRTTSIKHKQYTPPVEVPQNDTLTLLVNSEVLKWVPENINPGGLRVNSVKTDAKTKTAKIGLNENFTYLPVTSDLITDLRKHIETVLPDSINDYYVALNVGQRNYSYFITTIDKLPETFRKPTDFVTPVNPYVNAKNGMQGDIVAMWPSHGRYYKGKSGWIWQRPQMYSIVEDTNTLSFILPYAVPMIENAGGYVMLPRERDTNRNEVIVDNDFNESGDIFSQPYYKEMSGAHPWTTGTEDGFIYDLQEFRDLENPFENGTYRQTETITSGKPSIAAWYADIPEDGEYAVYVSYKTLPNSTNDARYIVNYSGGSREFKVNQQMGGSTWIYLGTFPLEAGYSDTEPIVTLTNISDEAGAIVTADAVKIGGGMGNIARSDSRSDVFIDPSTPEEANLLDQICEENEEESEDEEDDSEIEGDDEDIDETTDSIPVIPAVIDVPKGYRPTFKTSGMPRYLEGARYWMQWAGVPEYVYSPYHGTDDYKDDYTARGHWVNYLAGGSRVLPNRDGLNIPVDVVMALHSDAGKRADDSVVGTLGIFYTNGGDSYVDGTARTNSRSLTDLLMRQITGDIKQTFEPNWTRRSMWDKSYVEARVPEVPTSLIEFLSHQNFGDMKYCLDPDFRFTVGRSIYKALGRFVAERKDRKFIVQPLPVSDFYVMRIKSGIYRLGWKPTADRLEPTAKPSKYLIFERTDDELGFHLIGTTTSTTFDVKVNDNEIHSFKILAANEGGVSFPSEVLAFREAPNHSQPVLIINGFTRISGPASISNSDNAGFDIYKDFGVPYIKDISFIGEQTEFRRNAGESSGRCQNDYASQIIAGNTFDFVYTHGQAIANAGYGFVSTSIGAVNDGEVPLRHFKTIDLILGRQKTTVVGNGNTGFKYNAFPAKLQLELKNFTAHGGDLFVSGEYIMSDLLDYRSTSGSEEFAASILGIQRGEGPEGKTGNLKISGDAGNKTIEYSNTLNEKQYIVQHPDVISPSERRNGKIFASFHDTGMTAGVISHNYKSNVAVMSVPFESLINSSDRDYLMKNILKMIMKD